MIQARDLCLSFGSQIIFDHISFIINQPDRIGLVGRNGSGKTTLLKSILEPGCLDSGSISIQKGKKIAYMPQEVVLQSTVSILQETLTAFADVYKLQQEVQALEKLLETQSDPALVERYALLQEDLGMHNFDILTANVKKMLLGLGFSVEQLEQPVSSLSTGWKMRIVLAKLLLQEADFYLFDEPTNHLDLIAKEWFLSFLQQAPFGFVLICHERYFLDSLCDKIMEIELGKLTWYAGNYSKYITQKEENMQRLEAAFVQQQKEIKRKEATVARFKGGSARMARMALSMEKSLEKVERVVLPPSPKNVQFQFPPVQQSGKEVISVEHVSQTFGDKTIFKNVSFKINRGQKVALIAPNGVGKTTLFNIIAGILPLQHGHVTFGHNVTYSIFAQDQNKALNMNLSVIDNIKQICPDVLEPKIRAFLGAFLFSGEDVEKKVSVLSGGEKNRVGMVGVLLQQANLLLLDEPTNHLDIPSKEILLKALQVFKGTIVFVSHDRDFINDLATDIIELTRTGAHYYHGNYADYLYQKQIMQQPTAVQGILQPKHNHVGDAKPEKKVSSASAHQAIKQLETKITKLEQKIETHNMVFADLEYGTEEFNKAVQKLSALQKELKEAEEEWMRLQ